MLNLETIICDRLQENIDLHQKIFNDSVLIAQISRLSQMVLACVRQGGKIIFAGNGGSFSDSIHLAAEFVSRFKIEREPLAALALGANNSILTAVGNDYSYAEVFKRELSALGKKEDLLIAISTSGNSENIIRVAEKAREMGVVTFGLTGQHGGRMGDLMSCIKVPSLDTARIQEAHIMIGHIMCELVEKTMFDEGVLCL